MDAAGHCVVHALARDAEGGGRTNLGIGGQRRGLAVGVDASDAEVAHDFLDRERGGRGLGVDQQLTTGGIYQLACHASGLLGLAL